MAINTGRTDDCVLALLLLEKRAESDPDLAAWIEAELATAIPAPHSTTAGRRRNPSRPSCQRCLGGLGLAASSWRQPRSPQWHLIQFTQVHADSVAKIWASPQKL